MGGMERREVGEAEGDMEGEALGVGAEVGSEAEEDGEGGSSAVHRRADGAMVREEPVWVELVVGSEDNKDEAGGRSIEEWVGI